jgi:hypothetical protein
MKIIKDLVINLLALLVLVYLPCAFIIGEYNPLNWHYIYRAFYILIIVTIMTYGMNEYRKK